MSATSVTPKALAIHGGSPVRETLLPYGRQSLEETDIRAVVDVLRSDWLTTGPKVAEFEESFAVRVGAGHAVSFSSGTAALHGAAFAAGLKPGDEAIATPMTFAATANCVLYQGATPVFGDVCRDTLNLDPEQVEARITSRTRAILAVDYAGHPAELAPIQEIAKQKGLLVIEDACHALGAEYRGRRVGCIADMTVFSFHPVKHITTGEGGMVTTNDPRLAETLRRFRNHGISSDARQRQKAGQWHYEMVLLGFNYRLPDIVCALGCEQLKRLDANLARRREIAGCYTAAFREVPGVIAPSVRADVNPAWHLYPIRLNLEKLTADRAQIFRALRAENIGVNVHYIPVHYHPYYRDRFGDKRGEFPIAEDAYERLISLPMFHAMTDADVQDVVCAVRKVMNHFAS
ncbi:MAG: UDP-4-amino-4,6-dideoxy-N-acetyl-beta-L-altrosamine transaminase [Acidobacteriia bacterium]|nr:UDP-4-amino-4,6-dideoxy-N-acetyl-beta-L-altrosamine transaminase [Terriglobia bacterium]